MPQKLIIGNEEIEPHVKLISVIPRQGSQALTTIAYHENLEGFYIIKFYDSKVDREREKKALKTLGEHYPRFPQPTNSSEYDGRPYLRMTIGNEADIGLEDLQSRILTLEQILYFNESDCSKKAQWENILMLRNADFHTKLEYYSEIGERIKIIHAENIVHNDLKPSQILFLLLKNGGVRIQIIDFAMNIDLSNLALSHNYLYRSTTPLYSQPQTLRDHLDILKKIKSESGIEEELKADTKSLLARDIYSYLLMGRELLLRPNIHPYEIPARMLLERKLAETQGIGIQQRLADSYTKAPFKMQMLLESVLEASEEFLQGKKSFVYYASRKERKLGDLLLRSLASQPENGHSIDDILYRIEYLRFPFSKRMQGLKDFAKRKLTDKRVVIPLLAFLLIGGYLTYRKIQHDKEMAYLLSPPYLQQEIMTKFRDSSRIDSKKLRKFLARTVEERLLPALMRTDELSTPEAVSKTTGQYQSTSNEYFMEAYYPPTMWLAAELLKKPEIYVKYEKLIQNMGNDPGVGYRVFRWAEPLVQFFENAKHHNFSETTMKKAVYMLIKSAEKIDKHTEKNRQMQFFHAVEGETPKDKRYSHLLRADAYYIAVHSLEIANLIDSLKQSASDYGYEKEQLAEIAGRLRKTYFSHVEAVKQLLIDTKKEIVYDGFQFNIKKNRSNKKLIDGEPAEIYGTTFLDSAGRKDFYAYSLEQAITISLLLNFKTATADTSTLFRTLLERYEANLKLFGYPTEYLLPSNLDTIPANFPRSQNNLPLSMIVRSITENRAFFSEHEIDRWLMELMKWCDVSNRSEGILPKVKTTDGSPGAITLQGDAYTVKSFYNASERFLLKLKNKK